MRSVANVNHQLTTIRDWLNPISSVHRTLLLDIVDLLQLDIPWVCPNNIGDLGSFIIYFQVPDWNMIYWHIGHINPSFLTKPLVNLQNEGITSTRLGTFSDLRETGVQIQIFKYHYDTAQDMDLIARLHKGQPSKKTEVCGKHPNWLVVSNMNFIFHFINGMSSFPLTNSYFQDG